MAGMGEESIDLSKLGTGLFAFGFVLVIGLGIFTVGKSITNDGSEKVQKQLEVVQQSEFSDFDQTTVLGTKVKAAYDNFEGKGCAILVATRAMIDGNSTGLPTFDTSTIVSTTVTKSSAGLGHKIFVKNGEGAVKSSKSDGVLTDLWCMNYNAILEKPDLKEQNGYYVTEGSFLTDSKGSITFYNKVSNMKKQGMAEYIPTGAKYSSTLVKDTTGQVVGIMFQQISAN